jgi:peptidyl-prolyl cis-trans isomerase A (cyclophilin A)
MSEEVVKDSGLRMIGQHDGSGETPTIGDKVSIHYEIWLGEGTTTSNYDYSSEEYVDVMYDSTYEDKPYSGPIEVVVGQHTPNDDTYTKGDSILGFDEALLEMQVGEKRKLFIPSELAYGELGASSFHNPFGYRIPPNQAISCAIELVEIRERAEDREEKTFKGPAYEGA